MSECVVRMVEMPQHCFNCSEKVDPETRMCLLDGHLFEETFGVITAHRDKNCPILAVLPEKHGELIDRKSVYEKIKWWQENTHDTVTKAMLHEFYLMLYGVPAIVPATGGGNHERLD